MHSFVGCLRSDDEETEFTEITVFTTETQRHRDAQSVRLHARHRADEVGPA
jgi:hypothetical protein